MTIAQPIVRKISDNIDALNEFEEQIRQNESEKTKRIIVNYPTVYVHNLKSNNNYEVYVGESNNIFQRTRQHFDEVANISSWQNQLIKENASLYIIGHEHFNKSLTLDIENRLINYMMSAECVKRVYNGRGNPQKEYYPVDEFETIFNEVWKKLRAYNNELFPTISSIKDSAIFKASPLHKLTPGQEQAKEQIVQMIEDALRNNKKNQLVFIDGEAGTGKTVLNSSTFYELYCNAEERGQQINSWLIVNHDEQITVYQQIAKKLGLTDKYGDVVCKPTTFINNHSSDNPVDVVFVDEAHLLLTQGKQSYQGSNQLKDIIDRARVTVVMFDENQILSTEQFWEAKILEEFRNQAKKSYSYIILDEQLRMKVGPETYDWIDSFTKRCEIKRIPTDSKGYEIKVFDTPEELDYQIQLKARDPNTSLSRLIATYDWEYSSIHRPDERLSRYWEVLIGKWHKPWNRELGRDLDRNESRRNKNLAWAEQPQTLNEVGSTFTIQGFDLNYAGVILGPSVTYENGKIVFKPENSFDDKAVRNRTLSDNTKQKFGEVLIQHAVRVLMTRGVNGLYIYACDPALRHALKEATR